MTALLNGCYADDHGLYVHFVKSTIVNGPILPQGLSVPYLNGGRLI